jgi:hypothetical protein
MVESRYRRVGSERNASRHAAQSFEDIARRGKDGGFDALYLSRRQMRRGDETS